MSDHPSSPIPPLLPAVSGPVPDMCLGDDPRDREPITGMLGAIEALLRHPRRVVYQLQQASAGGLSLALLGIAFTCAVVYGAVVGTYSGHTQLWAAPVKIAGGLLLSALICLPSLYIFSCLSGAQARLLEVCGLVVGLLALMTLLLVGFAPVAWVFSQSTESVAAMGALHIVFWLIATGFGLRFLRAGFSQRGGRPAGLRIWMFLFVLVMLQMTAALRPLVGTSDQFLPKEKKFFISHWVETLQK